MIVNFRVCEINRGIRKLTRILTLIKKKNQYLSNKCFVLSTPNLLGLLCHWASKFCLWVSKIQAFLVIAIHESSIQQKKISALETCSAHETVKGNDF